MNEVRVRVTLAISIEHRDPTFFFVVNTFYFFKQIKPNAPVGVPQFCSGN